MIYRVYNVPPPPPPPEPEVCMDLKIIDHGDGAAVVAVDSFGVPVKSGTLAVFINDGKVIFPRFVNPALGFRLLLDGSIKQSSSKD